MRIYGKNKKNVLKDFRIFTCPTSKTHHRDRTGGNFLTCYYSLLFRIHFCFYITVAFLHS